MNNSRLDQNCVLAQLLKILPALLLSTVLVALLLFGLSRGAQARSARTMVVNLVANPGFEEPAPASWYNEGPHPPDWGYIWSGSVYHGCCHSAGIWSNVTHTGTWWSEFFAVTENLKYDFSGWIKVDDPSVSAFLTLAFYSSPSQEDPILTFDSTLVTGSSNWVQVEGSAEAPSGALYARTDCIANGTGTAWFDDINVSLVPRPTLEITKTDNPDRVQPGQNLIYTIIYSNAGDGPATDVVITETYDENVGFVAATPKADSDNRVWVVGPLDPGDSDSIVVTVKVSGTVTDGQILTNEVEIDCEQTENSISATITTVLISTSFTDSMVYLPLVLSKFCPLCNGGFETGDFRDGCWAHGGELAQSVQSKIVYEGNYAALLGNPDYPCKDGVPIGEAWMKQTFSVPSCLTPVLSFAYNVFSEDRMVSWSDSFEVHINDTLILSDGNRLRDESCDIPPWNSGWREFSYDLSEWRGLTTQVSFHNANRYDKWYNTWTYVDRVKVSCGP